MENLNFKEYFEEKYKAGKQYEASKSYKKPFADKIKSDKKKKQWKDPLNKYKQKMVRGIARQDQHQVPKGTFIPLLRGGLLPLTKRVLTIAKKSQQGIWKVSPRQAFEIANKYHLNMPTMFDKSKKLGKTSILLWMRTPGQYFLVKNKTLRDSPRTQWAWIKPRG